MTDREDVDLYSLDDSFLVISEEDLNDVLHTVEERCPEDASDQYSAGYGDGVFAVIQAINNHK